MKIKSFLSFIMLATVVTSVAGSATACDNSKSDELEINTANLEGRWTFGESFKKVDGKWVSDDSETSKTFGATSYILSPDGKGQLEIGQPEGFIMLYPAEWSLNSAKSVLVVQGVSYGIKNFKSDYMELTCDSAYDTKTGVMQHGEYMWKVYRRDPSQPKFLRSLIGKWIYKGTYEKKDGEWVKDTFAVPDEGWEQYFDNSGFWKYFRYGDQEFKKSCGWAANPDTHVIRWFNEKYENVSDPCTAEISDDGKTMTVYFDEDLNHVTGETQKGEFKDVFVKE